MPSNDKRASRRGPYARGADRAAARRELMKDPDVAAFAAALERISDADKRACLEWLVAELAKANRGSGNNHDP
jgi:hypothetical protein